jgi:diacylglycerol kinase family enzyme
MAKKKSDRRGRVVMAVSPKAGSGRGRQRLPALRDALENAGYEVRLSEQLSEIRNEALRDRADSPLSAVAVVGGDGSLSLVANTLPQGTPILPVPMGTENLLARYFGCSAEPAAVLAAVQHGRRQAIDAGTANGKLFLVMATCGFDAEVVRGMHLTRRGHIRRWSYFKPIVRAVRSYAYPEIRVMVPATSAGAEGERTIGANGGVEGTPGRPLTCRWAMVFNLPMYGGGLRIAPQAIPDDGQLDFIGLRRGGTRSTMQ